MKIFKVYNSPEGEISVHECNENYHNLTDLLLQVTVTNLLLHVNYKLIVA